MADRTGISWCDHTFNPFIGCTKVSAGCAHCYAERDNKRYHWVEGWGKGAPRKRTSPANWDKPATWAQDAVRKGEHRRVFCASLADVFDAEVCQDWREDLWDVIEDTLQINTKRDVAGSGLEWLILTKRPENIGAMLRQYWLDTPPAELRIGVTVENQANLHRIETLLNCWHGNNFVSFEPALEVVDFKGWLYKNGLWENGQQRIDWLIGGCESHGRHVDLDIFRSARDQCQSAGVPYFLKQVELAGKLVKMPFLDGKQWAEYPEKRKR